jgi:DNA processing protein
MDDPLAWLALARAPAVTRAQAQLLVERFGSPRAVLGAEQARLRAFCAPQAAEALSEAIPLVEAARLEIERSAALGIRVIGFGDSEFPDALRLIPDPPLALWARGALPSGPSLAVVGSRAASPRAREVARGWCASLARAGVWIISGLAYGVDAAAHRGALDGAGRTLAVLASGLDRPSPAGNVRMAREILESGGGWLSEHPPGVAALAHHFPERNRLISGVAQALWVVEARERSGSLWSARHALDQGREVFVTPGPVDTDLCRGSNALFRDGAGPVLEAADLHLALLGSAPTPVPGRIGPEGGVLARLRDGPADADGLARALGLEPAALAALLLELELDGSIRRQGNRISLARRSGATR